jgi:HK97 gp10 family phage protein
VNNVVLKTSIQQTIKELEKAEEANIKRASVHVQKKMREKVGKKGASTPGQPPGRRSGNLRKGIKTKMDGRIGIVGTGKPAYHAHMLEFGTTKMRPRPFFVSTFEEEESVVEKLVAGNWL